MGQEQAVINRASAQPHKQIRLEHTLLAPLVDGIVVRGRRCRHPVSLLVRTLRRLCQDVVENALLVARLVLYLIGGPAEMDLEAPRDLLSHLFLRCAHRSI